MGSGIDLTLQDLLRAFDGQGGNLATQGVARLVYLLIRVVLGSSNDTRCFFGSGFFWLLR
jgi:hypothetical protein